MSALATSTIHLGLNVTNPGTREPTVTASAFATLQDITGGRMIMGIGRGDSARRVIGQKPTTVAELERAVAMMRDLMNGRPFAHFSSTSVPFQSTGRPEVPVYVAGYGP